MFIARLLIMALAVGACGWAAENDRDVNDEAREAEAVAAMRAKSITKAVVIKVTDQHGQPLPNIPVSQRVSSLRGRLLDDLESHNDEDRVNTDPQGVARLPKRTGDIFTIFIAQKDIPPGFQDSTTGTEREPPTEYTLNVRGAAEPKLKLPQPEPGIDRIFRLQRMDQEQPLVHWRGNVTGLGSRDGLGYMVMDGTTEYFADFIRSGNSYVRPAVIEQARSEGRLDQLPRDFRIVCWRDPAIPFWERGTPLPAKHPHYWFRLICDRGGIQVVDKSISEVPVDGYHSVLQFDIPPTYNPYEWYLAWKRTGAEDRYGLIRLRVGMDETRKGVMDMGLYVWLNPTGGRSVVRPRDDITPGRFISLITDEQRKEWRSDPMSIVQDISQPVIISPP